MSLKSWALRFFERKDSQARVLISQVQSGPYVALPKNYEGYSKEAYTKCVIANRSIAQVARSLSVIPWILYSKPKSKNSKRTEIEDHKILDLLKRPNPMQGQASFFEAVEAFKLISGNSYIEAIGTKKAQLAGITELWPVRPDRMTIKPGTRGYPAAFVYKVGQRETMYPVDLVTLKSPILHLKFFNPVNDWYGLSPVEAAAFEIDQHNAANKWNVAMLQNSARPSGALVATVTGQSTGHLGEDAFIRLKKEIEEHYSGPANAGRPMVLEGGLDWKPFALTPQQMEFIESKNSSARDVALAFGVPPMLLGIPGDNTYSNYKEARAALYEETVLPEHDFIRDELNHWLVPAFGDGLYVDSNRDAIHALAPRRQEVWDKVSSASFLTENEKREATGYEPVEGGDVILVSATMVPLQDAVEPTEEPDTTGQNDKPDNEQDQEDDDATDDKKPPKKFSEPMFEAKVFNLPNQRARLKEWRGQIRLRKAFERKLMRQSQAVLEIEGHRVADVVKGLDLMHAEVAARREIEASKAQWKHILKANISSTTRGFGARVFNSLKSHPLAIERKESETQFEAFTKRWIEEHSGEAITGIEETTKQRVLKALRDAQEEALTEGEPVREFSKAVQDAYDGFSANRAMTIARTETGIAANVAMVEAAKSTGIPGLKKEWVSTQDDRTREDHASVDGSVVDIDGTFDVGGSKMSQPMDPAGPPEEVINCRCCTVFQTGNEGE